MADLAVQNSGVSQKYCFECGANIRASAEICPKCGVRQAMISRSSKNKLVAALLAILLGGVGIHKFYLGKIGQGILYLVFCWTFIPALIGFFEGIFYLATSDENFARHGDQPLPVRIREGKSGWKFAVFCIGCLALAIYAAQKPGQQIAASAPIAKGQTPPANAPTFDKRYAVMPSLSFSQDVVEAAVRPVLRDPQSAIFRDLSATNDRKIGKSPAGLVVCGYVNAKNGFGGYTGDKMFINFYATRMVEIEPTPNTNKFNASWNKLCAG